MTKRLQEALNLQERLACLIKKERQLLNEVLDAIIEADRLRSYLELGYSSLHVWLTKHFLYSESAAWRRIDSARMKRAVPEVSEKIESGAVNLSNLARAQCAIRAEETRTKTRLSADTKAELIEKIEKKSGIETEKILKAESPEAKIFQNEKVRVVSASEITVQIVLSHEEYELFKRAQELLSHSVPSGSPGKVVAAICKDYVQRKDPLHVKKSTLERLGGAELCGGKVNVQKQVRTEQEKRVDHSAEEPVEMRSGTSPISNSAAEFKISTAVNSAVGTQNFAKPSRHIPSAIRRMVFRRDQGSCQAKIHQTDEVCGSRYQVEVDHIQPWALGGTHKFENLQCLCAKHNRHRSEKTFGTRDKSGMQ